MALILFLQSCTTGVETKSWEQTYTLEELQEDFHTVEETIRKKHPMLYTDEAAWEFLLEAQYNKLTEGMSLLAFYRVLAPVVAGLDCGHTNLLVPEDYQRHLQEEEKLLPLSVQIQQEKLFVGAHYSDNPIPRGTEIQSINGRSAREILSIMIKNISTDGPNTDMALAIIENQFSYLYHTMIDPGDQFQVTLVSKDRELTTRLLEGRGYNLGGYSGKRLSSINVLLNMGALKSKYYQEVYQDYAYLQVGSFILNQKDYSRFLEDFFKEVKGKNIDSLILDLRGNWGGPPKGAAELFTYLISKPTPYLSQEAPFYFFSYKKKLKPSPDHFTGKVYILTDSRCFSTTGHLLALLKYHNIGTIIGEVSGGDGSCTDAKRKKVLPNTGLRLYYATRVFSAAVEGLSQGEGLAPDIPVEESQALEKARSLIAPLRYGS